MPTAQVWQERYPILKCRCDEFVKKFSPDYPIRTTLLLNMVKANEGTTPTLTAVTQVYGLEATQAVISSWLARFSSYVGKGTLSADQIEMNAQLIIKAGHYLKLAEIAIFFQKLMGGELGDLYGNINPIWIMEQFQTFLSIRRTELAKADAQKERDRLESERQRWREEAATPEEIAKIKEKYQFESFVIAVTGLNIGK